MIAFLAAAAVAVAIVLVLLARPFFRLRAASGPTQAQQNAQILREQFQKLDTDLAEGTLGREDYEQAKAELKRRALDEQVQEGATSPAAAVRAPRKTIVAVAVLMPLVASALYLAIGRPQGVMESVASRREMQHQLEGMVQSLADRLEKEPGNLKGWSMLARSYKVMGRPADAQRAFERAGNFIDNDAELLAEYADVVAANAGGSLSGKPKELIDKALKVDPNHPMALWLAGTAALNDKQYDEALKHWEKLLPQLPPGSQDAQTLAGAIEEARSLGGKPPLAAAMPKSHPPIAMANASSPAAATADTKVASANPAAGVSGTVDISADLKSKAAPTDTLMIIARIPGTRMPLAVIRTSASKLPMPFTLDDTVAMNPQAGISSVPEVEVEARISKSGMAVPQPGDLLSAPQKVKVGAKGLKLQVAQVRQ